MIIFELVDVEGIEPSKEPGLSRRAVPDSQLTPTRPNFCLLSLVEPEGVEPTHGGLKGRFLIQLNYGSKFFRLLLPLRFRTRFRVCTNR